MIKMCQTCSKKTRCKTLQYGTGLYVHNIVNGRNVVTGCKEGSEYNPIKTEIRYKKVVITELDISYTCELDQLTYNSLKKSNGVMLSTSRFEKTEKTHPLEKDEVSIDDVDINKIYAAYSDETIYIIKKVSDNPIFTYYPFLYANGHRYTHNYESSAILNCFDVYEFNTQKDFLEWAIEVTK